MDNSKKWPKNEAITLIAVNRVSGPDYPHKVFTTFRQVLVCSRNGNNDYKGQFLEARIGYGAFWELVFVTKPPNLVTKTGSQKEPVLLVFPPVRKRTRQNG